jgi:uncharacterized protein (DUF1810 family)
LGLQRFKDAQDGGHAGFDRALSEIRAGRKRGHWIWYIFPQLAGLGRSEASRVYGIRGVAEAETYLRDPVLHGRLVTIATAVADQLDRGISLEHLMGSSIDATKLVSSMTLSGAVAKRLSAGDRVEEYASLASVADRILSIAAAQGYPRCEFTHNVTRESQEDRRD